MHVVFLSVSSEFGGSEAVLCELVRGLRARHAEWPLTAILPREGVLGAKLRDAGASVRVLPIPPALLRLGESADGALARGAGLIAAAATLGGYTRRLRSLLTELAPDVIHSNGFKLHVLSARAKPDATPLVWHVHEYVGARPLSRRLLRHHRGRAALVITNSRSVATDVGAALGSTPPIKAVYNAVDVARFSPEGPSADLDALAGVPAPPPDVVRVGLVATFGRWKGHDVFMQAVARLDGRNVRAYIVGGSVYDTAGSQYTIEELKTRARDLGLAGRLVFTGIVEDMAPALRALDVVVHASTQPEPFGLVIAEAMACGRAVVVSAAGGAAEIVRADVDALVHEPGDAESLASALTRAVDDPMLRGRLGTAARASAVARFDAREFAREFDGIYRALAHPAGVHDR